MPYFQYSFAYPTGFAIQPETCANGRTLLASHVLIGQELEVKLIRDRHRGIVAGYGFIDFRNHETAQLVLDTLNGKPIGGYKWKTSVDFVPILWTIESLQLPVTSGAVLARVGLSPIEAAL